MSSLGAFKSALESLFRSPNPQNMGLQKCHDPLSTLIRFALVALKPEGTKLNILNHKITYRPPHSQQAYQIHYPVRDQYHWREEEFHILKEPIAKAILWYSKELVSARLFELALVGLQRLYKTYERKSGEAKTTIALFTSMIEDGIQRATVSQNAKGPTDDKLEHFLYNLWTAEEIHVIYRLLTIGQKRQEEVRAKNRLAKKSLQSAVNAIEVILQEKEAKLLRFASSHFQSS